MTLAIEGHKLGSILLNQFPDTVVETDVRAAWVPAHDIVRICRFLHDVPGLNFDVLNAVTAVDYVDHFEVIYQMTSIDRNVSTILKVRVYGRDTPSIPSVTSVWRGATLQEREIWDLMGIDFDGHPEMKRILTWEGFDGHPLRRDYLEPPLPYTWPHGG